MSRFVKEGKENRHIGCAALTWTMRNRLVKDYRVAIDGGACKGEWTRRLSILFDIVHAFEPCSESFDILKNNVAWGKMDNVILHQKALMDHKGMVEVFAPRHRSTLTARQVKQSIDGDTQAIDLDSLMLTGVGLIKLDLEGAEPLALRGARKTIKRCKPVLIVEFNKQTTKRFASMQAQHDQLTGMGYLWVQAIDVDRVYIPAS